MTTLPDDTLAFIDSIQQRFPDKPILENFRAFLKLDPKDRPAEAQRRIDALPRSGYVQRGIARDQAETVGEHVRDMKRVSAEITGFLLAHLNDIIDVHDMAEAIVGDFMPTDDIHDDEKHRLEEIAIELIFEAQPEMIAAWKEYETGSTMSGRMAKDIDKLQMWDQSEIYKKQYPELKKPDGVSNFQDLIDAVVNRDLGKYGSINTVNLYHKRREQYAITG